MGMIKLFSSSSYKQPSYDNYDSDGVLAPNPDPENYNVVKRREVNGYTILLINYPGCTNYEGLKILVFESMSYMICSGKGKIDPHFCKDEKFSPIARFEPTDKGWDMAIEFAKIEREKYE